VFDEIAFLPRTLVNVQHRNQSSTLLGQRTASPFMIGPTGYSGLMFGEGDVQLASTAAAGMPFVLSNASTVALEDVVQRGVRKRDWDLRNYIKPLMLDWRNKFDVLGHPRWIAAIFAGGC
jgi:(S)-mandelate dehydrogenase